MPTLTAAILGAKYIIMWDTIFFWCVYVLDYGANLTGLTYNRINVIIFCILWPLFTLYWFILSYRARKQIYRLLHPTDMPNHFSLLFPLLSKIFSKNK